LGCDLYSYARGFRQARVDPRDQSGGQLIEVRDLLFKSQDAPRQRAQGDARCALRVAVVGS